jgi:hypothetical protein
MNPCGEIILDAWKLMIAIYADIDPPDHYKDRSVMWWNMSTQTAWILSEDYYLRRPVADEKWMRLDRPGADNSRRAIKVRDVMGMQVPIEKTGSVGYLIDGQSNQLDYYTRDEWSE